MKLLDKGALSSLVNKLPAQLKTEMNTCICNWYTFDNFGLLWLSELPALTITLQYQSPTQWCNTNVLSDEFHYLLQCSFFEEDRRTLYSLYVFTHTSFHKFSELMNAKEYLFIWRYLTRELIWHLSQSTLRPSIYF